MKTQVLTFVSFWWWVLIRKLVLSNIVTLLNYTYYFWASFKSLWTQIPSQLTVRGIGLRIWLFGVIRLDFMVQSIKWNLVQAIRTMVTIWDQQQHHQFSKSKHPFWWTVLRFSRQMVPRVCKLDSKQQIMINTTNLSTGKQFVTTTTQVHYLYYLLTVNSKILSRYGFNQTSYWY